MVRRAPHLAAYIVAAWHEIGVHGWEHKYLTLRGPRATYRDIAMAADEIIAATGVSPRLYRPPYGVLNAGALVATRRLRLTPVLWDCWGKEWSRGSTPESVFATLSATLRDGSTVLLHDSDHVKPGRRTLVLARCRCCWMNASGGGCWSARSASTSGVTAARGAPGAAWRTASNAWPGWGV
jgi:peptidoglycan/xylan/chitin deacetylase (PgdA/CDA1 family)